MRYKIPWFGGKTAIFGEPLSVFEFLKIEAARSRCCRFAGAIDVLLLRRGGELERETVSPDSGGFHGVTDETLAQTELARRAALPSRLVRNDRCRFDAIRARLRAVR